jgi:hypothetical protein
MGAEIKQTLERSYDLVLSAQEIRDLTFARLQELSTGSPAPDPAQTNTLNHPPHTNGLSNGNDAIVSTIYYTYNL